MSKNEMKNGPKIEYAPEQINEIRQGFARWQAQIEEAERKISDLWPYVKEAALLQNIKLSDDGSAKLLFFTMDRKGNLVFVTEGPYFRILEKARAIRRKVKGNEYRTKRQAKEAGAITEPLKKVVTPSRPGYELALFFNDAASEAGLNSLNETLVKEKGLELADIKALMNATKFRVAGEKADGVNIENLFTSSYSKDYNIGLLMKYFSFAYRELEKENFYFETDIGMTFKITIQAIIGRNSVHRGEREKVLHDSENLQKLMGVMPQKRGIDRISVFNLIRTDGDIIQFTCPYIISLINDLRELSFLTDKHGNRLLTETGAPLVSMDKSFQYLAKPGLLTSKNRIAAANVILILNIITQAGKHVPHFSFKYLLTKNLAFKAAMETDANKRTLLKRVAQDTFNLLREETFLLSDPRYKGIKLPDGNKAELLPTLQSIDKVYKLTYPAAEEHERKIELYKKRAQAKQEAKSNIKA